MNEHDLIIIGAGPAGLAAAIEASKKGVKNITVVDRLNAPGGMLTQCFHHGFGMGMFGEELSGPDFVSRLLSSENITITSEKSNQMSESNSELNSINLTDRINILTNSFVSEIDDDFTVNIINEEGLLRAKPKAIIVATGCRERPIGTLDVYGSRPAGVFTAGSVQRMINLFGYKFGKRAVVLGSGDVGMIVSHHLMQTGTEVVAVIEKLSHINGLAKNKNLYLNPNNIPVKTGSTVSELHGENRLQAVTVCDVDSDGNILPETGHIIECDTLITSVGLIPELEIIRNLPFNFSGDYIQMSNPPCTSLPNVFVCGNANKIHSFVDTVISEGSLAGELASNHILSLQP